MASISRGYDDLVDEMTITFWAISTKTLVTILGGIILLILILTWLIRTFDFHIVKQKRRKMFLLRKVLILRSIKIELS